MLADRTRGLGRIGDGARRRARLTLSGRRLDCGRRCGARPGVGLSVRRDLLRRRLRVDGRSRLRGDDWRDGGVHLVNAPLYHRGPFIVAMVALHCGHQLVLMDRWLAESALELIEREQVTTCYVVPTMMHRLVRLPESKRAEYDIGSLRYVLHSAAPCPVAYTRRPADR